MADPQALLVCRRITRLHATSRCRCRFAMHTQLMKDMDYGKDYKYPHHYYKDMQIDDPERPTSVQLQEYLPEKLKGGGIMNLGSRGRRLVF